ncbi:Tvp15 protein [Saccharomycopsis crataegensis]|uniref:Tvp15 protein n=1 Tax=Saccharomycopsis crataegensis TaxID=43959 RepID=A0AAV5QWZ4_9ASCO|nr:Tvp15 protein [Saccharomycopsis crataegensis]
MDFSNISDNTRDFSNAFKIANFAVGALSVLCGISQLLSGFQDFFLGLFVIFFGAGIIFLEIRVPQEVYNYASFLFSFIGRGIFYLLIGIIVSHDHILRVFPGFLISFVGIGYCALQFVPNILPPENMRSDFAALHNQDEEDVI